ncbi:esterase/lipase family protein [Salisaeta longa]|uniref:esterase/lipase family protein n=1 Tax=Salisaeta longa TaxID=503170 RepID=UPI0012F9DFC8|nr:hypothetical protein [Salisaeta longa]
MRARWHTGVLAIAGTLLALGLTGCSQSRPRPDLNQLYDRAAQYHGIERNPIILIPGILGSKLTHAPSGTTVWGAFTGEYANPEEARGARLLALPMQRGKSLRQLTDSVYANGALQSIRLRVAGLPIKLGAYVNIMRTLGIGGYRDASGALNEVNYGAEHFTCFQFAYDWRRDNVENAQRLHAFIQEKKAYLRKEYKERYGVTDPNIQFDIVAHSMGGLLLRYYLRYGAQDLPRDGSLPTLNWAGAQQVDRVALVGTPNAGAAKALYEMAHGKDLSPVTPTYPAALLGTMPAAYQLLPRSRHGALRDARDPSIAVDSILSYDFWVHMQWGLADPAQDRVLKQLLPEVERRKERRAIALNHLKKSLRRARRFYRSLDTTATRPSGVQMALYTGDALPTLQTLTVNRQTGALKKYGTAPGDGTVLRSSALMDERVNGTWQPYLVSPIDWSNVTMIFEDHVGMTQSTAFADNLLYYLLLHPYRDERS